MKSELESQITPILQEISLDTLDYLRPVFCPDKKTSIMVLHGIEKPTNVLESKMHSM